MSHNGHTPNTKASYLPLQAAHYRIHVSIAMYNLDDCRYKFDYLGHQHETRIGMETALGPMDPLGGR